MLRFAQTPAETPSFSILHVTATGTGGITSYRVFNYSSSASIRNSSLAGDDYSIDNSFSASAQVADTMLDGTVDAGFSLTCTSVYDEAFVALDSSCAVIP